jgi:predicted double-glycine peptidase
MADAGWNRVFGVELVRQRESKDCGSAALSTVLRYWQPNGGRAINREGIEAALRRDSSEGLAAGELRDHARQNGFPAYVIEGAFSDLQHEVDRGRPVIVGVHKPISSGEALRHYEVFIGYHPKSRQVLTLDPANGLRQNGVDGFSDEWQQAGNVMLVVMPPDARAHAKVF